jgi:GNAT superfamily N-acetyltransferase
MTAQLDAGRVSIRPAVPSDLATIVEFRLAMFDDISGAEAGLTPRPESLRRDNERWVAEHLDRDFFAWIAELDGRPVASAGLIWFAHPPGPLNPIGKEAYILNVYTRPEARRLGLARALMERLAEEARLAGVRRVWLRASDEGRPLYESMGFRAGNYLELKPDQPGG